jgi:hypothetical protein
MGVARLKNKSNVRSTSSVTRTGKEIEGKEMPSDRKKGYVGKTIDGKKLADIANAIYKLQYVEPSICTMDDYLLLELAETDAFGDHKIALICNEGVGWIQDEYGTIEVPTNLGQFGYLGGRVHISVEVIKTCITDNTIEVSDYVRTFGSRLDNNCSLWQGKMKKETVTA